MASGDPKAADFGVTLERDCWESLTTSGSGVSIVRNVATESDQACREERDVGAADGSVLNQSVDYLTGLRIA